MKLIQICVLNTFLTSLLLFWRLQPVDSCLSFCTCTTVPASEADTADDEDDGDEENDDDIALPNAPKGRKVNCSNNPYRFSSMEDVQIPLDTIYL